MATESDDLICLECGYDLRGIESARCPECGWEIDRDGLGKSRIPWVNRAELGRWSAYWRTVSLAIWRRKRLALEAVRPVEMRDGRRFASVTALIVGLPGAVMMFAIIAQIGGTSFLNPIDAGKVPMAASTLAVPMADVILPYAAGATRWAGMPLAILLTSWLVTRAPALWLNLATAGSENEERRRRGEALSYYTAAPLVLLPVAAMCWMVPVMKDGVDAPPELAWVIAGSLLALFALVASMVSLLTLLRRSQGASGVRLLVSGIGLPLMWGVCAGAGFFLLPWVVGLMWLMFDSLR